MDAEREARLAEVLLMAFELPASERRAGVEEACGNDPELLAEVLACLDREDDLDDFLEHPPAPAVLDAAALESTARAPATRLDAPRRRRPREPPGTAAASRPASPTTAEAFHIGPYRVIGRIGEGGMGQVFAAEDERLGRQVAIKILPPDMADRADWLARFEREARALAALNHPHIVTIHSIEQNAAGARFLTMELVEGETLKEKIAAGPLPVEDALRIALEMSEALAAAHQRGVIHRDLKPANVMVTGEGRVKVLDFGIAKLAQAGETTQDGLLIGTVGYMAPEQLRGDPVDARTDLFAFGILLFEMVTGKHPFPAGHQIARIKKILEEAPADLAILRPDLPPELAGLIERCLDKDARQRPATAGAVYRELAELRDSRRAREIIQSRTDLQLVPASPSWRSRPAAALGVVLVLAVLVALLAAGTWRVARTERAGAPGPDAVAAKTTLAVLPFENLTDEPALAWLADGIAELLTTDLAQSPDLLVFGRAEVLRLLAPTGGADSRPGAETLGAETLRAVAEQGDLHAVVRGSYARLGETLRVTLALEDPRAGRVLRAASFEGTGEESLFGLVDQLAAAVLDGAGAARPDFGPASVGEATTSSLLAWQAYTESQILYLEESRTAEAIARLEEALEIDPDFALATVSAAKMHQSLGHGAAARAHTERALESVDSLPLRTRFEVEAGYWGLRWATLGRAIETYALAPKVYPREITWRNNLARRYAFFERYAEAREEFERALASGSDYWGTIYGLANAHAALGDFALGQGLLEEALAARPEHWLLRYSLAWHLSEGGRFDEAERAFAWLEERRPEDPRVAYGRWRLALLRGDAAAADAAARRLLEIDDPFARWRAHLALARNALFAGRSHAAREHYEAAITAASGADRALLRCSLAELMIHLGEATAALEQAALARVEGQDHWPELEAVFLAARANQALGRDTEADALLELLRERWRRQPNAVEERQWRRLLGLLEIARGNAVAGRDALERAAALLPPRGVEFSWHVFPDHVPLWVDLGSVELSLGRADAARGWLERARGAGAERLERPLAYGLGKELLQKVER